MSEDPRSGRRGGASSSTLPSRPGLLGLSPAAAGAAYCVISALGYSAANVCLRRLAELQCDPLWVIFNKELVAVLIVGPWLLVQALRGLPALPSGRSLGLLVLVGLATQLGGNAGEQWALGIAGLAVTVPTIVAAVLTAAGILGWLLLGERVSPRSMAAIALLVAAVALLCVGAEAVRHPAADAGELPTSSLRMAQAVGVAVGAGIIFALLSIAIRHCVTGTTPLSAVVLIITGMGVVSLGPLSVYRLGWEQLVNTPGEHVQWMAAAGVCNLVAFFALSKALQLTTVVHVNMVNASQVALAALAGTVLFGEKANSWLLLGILLTIAGILLMGRPDDGMVDQHV